MEFVCATVVVLLTVFGAMNVVGLLVKALSKRARYKSRVVFLLRPQYEEETELLIRDLIKNERFSSSAIIILKGFNRNINNISGFFAERYENVYIETETTYKERIKSLL